MIWEALFLGCGVWSVWRFARGAFRAFRRRYILWSYSRASSGSKVYEVDDPKRFRIGAWTNVVGLAFAITGTCRLTTI